MRSITNVCDFFLFNAPITIEHTHTITTTMVHPLIVRTYPKPKYNYNIQLTIHHPGPAAAADAALPSCLCDRPTKTNRKNNYQNRPIDPFPPTWDRHTKPSLSHCFIKPHHEATNLAELGRPLAYIPLEAGVRRGFRANLTDEHRHISPVVHLTLFFG